MVDLARPDFGRLSRRIGCTWPVLACLAVLAASSAHAAAMPVAASKLYKVIKGAGPRERTDLYNALEATDELIRGQTGMSFGLAEARYLGPTTNRYVVMPQATNALNLSALTSAISASSAAGGGEVDCANLTYYLTSTITVPNGVVIKGVPTSVTSTGNVPDSIWAYTAGTKFDGTSLSAAAPAFAANTTAKASPDASFADNLITGGGFVDLYFYNCPQAIAIGGPNNIGVCWSRYQNLFFDTCGLQPTFNSTGVNGWVGFAFELINPMHVDVRELHFRNCKSDLHIGSYVAAAVLQCGNLDVEHIFAFDPTTNQYTNWHYLFDSSGTSASLNEVHARSLQDNNFNLGQLSTTLTCIATSTNWTVGSATNLQVGQPFTPSGTNATAAASGIVAGQQYFILSISGTTITIGNSRTGAAIAAVTTESTNLNLTTYGMPILDISIESASASVNNSTWDNLDLEGHSQAALYCELTASCSMQLNQVPTNGESIVMRGALNTKAGCYNQYTLDADAASSSSCECFGSLSTAAQYRLRGLKYDSTLVMSVLDIGAGAKKGNFHDLQYRTTASQYFIYPYTPMGINEFTSAGSSLNFAGNGTLNIASGSSPSTWTLPAITNASAATSYVGCEYDIINTGTSTVTIATSSSQPLGHGGGSTTGATLTQGQMYRFLASVDAAGNLFWVTIAENGATIIP